MELDSGEDAAAGAYRQNLVVFVIPIVNRYAYVL